MVGSTVYGTRTEIESGVSIDSEPDIIGPLKLAFGHSPRNQIAGKWQPAEGFMAGA
jgi:hypothetical protein